MNLTGYRFVVKQAVGCDFCKATPTEACRSHPENENGVGYYVPYVHDERSFAYHNTLGVVLPD